MQTILDWLPVGVFILDSDFRVVHINSHIEKFFGYSREVIVGMDKREVVRDYISPMMHRTEDFQQRVLATYDHNYYIEKFICHVLPDGERQDRWLEHLSQPIEDGVYKGGRVEVYSDITQRVVAEEHISWLSSQLLQIQERQNARIARDLHDELGQGIVAQKMLIESALQSLENGKNDEATERLHTVLQELTRLGTEIRRISTDLMPSMLEPLGLQETMVWMCGNFKKLYNIDVEFESMGFNAKRLPSKLEITIFRIFQEGMNNIVKHSQSRSVKLHLIYSYPKIIVSIRDDGQGFANDSATRGLGLRFMRQRVSELGGTMKIETKPGRGTAIRVEIPYFDKPLINIPI